MVVIKPVLIKVLILLSLSTSFIPALAQQPRYVDPSNDAQRLPGSGGSLGFGGDDAQIVRFRCSTFDRGHGHHWARINLY